MLTITEFAKKHGVTRSWVHNLLLQGRIKGAKRRHLSGVNGRGVWLIPEAAKIKPIDRHP